MVYIVWVSEDGAKKKKKKTFQKIKIKEITRKKSEKIEKIETIKPAKAKQMRLDTKPKTKATDGANSRSARKWNVYTIAASGSGLTRGHDQDGVDLKPRIP